MYSMRLSSKRTNRKAYNLVAQAGHTKLRTQIEASTRHLLPLIERFKQAILHQQPEDV
jgi:hypothetical protein